MASIINSTTTAGVTVTGDNSGSLQLATNNGTTALTIDTSQNVGIGTTSPTVPLQIYNATNASIFMQGDAGANVTIQRYSTNATQPSLILFKARGTLASPTAVATNDQIGSVVFQAYGGTNTRSIAGIRGYAETYTSDTDISSYLWFGTTPSGTTSIVERMRIASDGTISTTIGSTLYGAYPARAWVNFNGTGTVAIRTSRNVSSITDSGTGQYTVNFTTSMPDGEYSLVGTTNADTRVVSISSLSTSGGAIRTTNSAGALEDQSVICVTMFR